MNLYKISTIGLLTAIVVACGAAGTDTTPVARADDGTAGSTNSCACTGQGGPQGVAGPAGPAGPQGPAGKDAVCINDLNSCPPGVPGAQGPVGPAGPKGDDGLDGVDGMPGSTGPAGPAGEKGLKGDKGDVGPAGPPGVAGKDGLSITKGNLYYRAHGANASVGSARAYCDDDNDVAISGYCQSPTGIQRYAGVFISDDPKTFAGGWYCDTGVGSTSAVWAYVVCLEVP